MQKGEVMWSGQIEHIETGSWSCYVVCFADILTLCPFVFWIWLHWDPSFRTLVYRRKNLWRSYVLYIYYIHFLYFNIQSLQTLLSSLLPRIYCLILNQSPMCTALFLRCLSSPKIDSCSPYKSWALPMFNFFGGHLRSLIYRFWIILKPISSISLSGAKRRPCGLDTIRNGPLLG